MAQDEWQGGPWDDGSDVSAKSTVDKILDFSVGIGVPIARIALGASAERQANLDRQRYNLLNGSGSNDWELANGIPDGYADWAFGTPQGQRYGQSAGVIGSAGNANPVVIGGLILGSVILTVLLLRR